MNFEMAKGDSPEELIKATQRALLFSMRQFVIDLRSEMNQPGLTWDQLDYFLVSFEKKKPVIFEQSEEM